MLPWIWLFEDNISEDLRSTFASYSPVFLTDRYLVSAKLIKQEQLNQYRGRVKSASAAVISMELAIQ